MKRLAPLFLTFLLGAAALQPAAADTRRYVIPETIVTGRDQGLVNVPSMQISGDFRRPETPDRVLPAILIVHGDQGPDGRGIDMSRVLNEQGFITFEIDMWRPRGLKGGPSSRPASYAETLPDVFGALDFLSRQSDVDPARIGILGYSWGAALAIWSQSRRINELYNDRGARFGAHVALYPRCSPFMTPVLASHFQSMTGAPLLVHVPAENAMEPANSCQAFIERLPAPVRTAITIKSFNGTIGWDARRETKYFDPQAESGKGAQVVLRPDAEITSQSRQEIVEFFRRSLRQR